MIINKKAQGQIWHFVDLMFTFFILIFIFFFVSFLINTEKESTVDKISAVSNEFKAEDALMVYLQSPVELEISGENQSMTIADSLMFCEIDDKSVDQGLTNTQNLLNPVFGSTKWAVNVCYPRSGAHSGPCWLYFNLNRWQNTKKGLGGNLLGEAEAKIPSLQEGDITVKFRLLK